MGFCLGVIMFLLVALTCNMVVESANFARWDTTALRFNSVPTTSGDWNLGDDTMYFIDDPDGRNDPSRRFLGGNNYISYGALQKNNVPCNRRGNSYYNCNQRGKANPYKRGCSQITRCARKA